MKTQKYLYRTLRTFKIIQEPSMLKMGHQRLCKPLALRVPLASLLLRGEALISSRGGKCSSGVTVLREMPFLGNRRSHSMHQKDESLCGRELGFFKNYFQRDGVLGRCH